MKAKFTKTSRCCIARLDKGERLLDSILALSKLHKIKSGIVEVIGALRPAEIMYYEIDKKAYKSILIDEPVELIMATGSIALLGSDPVVHLHITIGRHDGTTLGGHCGPASTISITGEVFIIEIVDPVYRVRNEDFKLNFLDLER